MTSFNRFYETWYDHLNRLVRQLYRVSKPAPTAGDHHDGGHNHDLLDLLVATLLDHYSEYYRVKSLTADRDILSVVSASWSSSLEYSLHWIAGFRPTTLFHLVYSESSVHFESRILDILRGHTTGGLGDLSPAQFRSVSELQCKTVAEENAITDELGEWQENSAAELMAAGGGGESDDGFEAEMERLVRVVQRADELRLRTVRAVVELLNPLQAVEFLIAAAELQFGVRAWGTKNDRQRGYV